MKNIKEKINLGLYLKATEFDSEHTATILDTIQEAWDNGESFLAVDMMDMFDRREPGNEEQELQAAVSEAEKALRWKIVIPTYISRLQRADAVSLCGEQLDAREIVDLWNKQHPGEEIFPAPSFEL